LHRVADGSDPVTSDSPDLALTARALKDRGLITMPKTAGKWRAEITEAGSFYLEHGHHPDKPEQPPRRKKPAAGETQAARSPSPAKEPAAPDAAQVKKVSTRAT